MHLRIIFIAFISSCITIQPDKKESHDRGKKTSDGLIFIHEEASQKPEELLLLREFFVDSTNIGNKGFNKLEARLFEFKDSIFIRLEFFSLRQNRWTKKNHFEFEKDGISGIDPIITDFNNDSLKDFQYKVAIAARGANDIGRLFIYDKQGDSLILIKNSIDYPNMLYNKNLDCIDALLIHGCSSQAFLKIEKDSLIEFAWIHLSNRIHVYEIDERGNEHAILNDSINEFDCYTRFLSYNPLIKYESSLNYGQR